MVRRVAIVLVLIGLGLFVGSPANAQSTGTITGVVSDNTGGVMPGVSVTLSSESMIGGAQNQVTDARGVYRYDRLAPGAYKLVVELQGFKTMVREDIHVSANFTATVNLQLQVGQLEESITVTGASPTVDTKSDVQQTVMNQDLMERIPSGRDVWSLAKLIPGMNGSTYDVGGTQGMQATLLSSHGSTTSDQTFAIDGVAVNWPGGGGGSTMMYYDQGMFEEINYETSAIPAEVAVGGVFMNMVTKSGSNTWKGDVKFYYANPSLQSDNFANVSKQFNYPGGNPITEQYDFNGTGSGPIIKDKMWLFGSFRRWRVDKKVLSVVNPDGTNPTDHNLIRNGSAKLTTQINPNHRFTVVYNYNFKERFPQRGTTPAYTQDSATVVQQQPAYDAQAKYTAVLGGSSTYENSIGLMDGTYPRHQQPSVLPTDLYHEDSVLSTAWGAAPPWSDNPNYRLEWDNVFSHTQEGFGGRHNLKAGVQFIRQYYQYNYHMNGDMGLYFNNGVAYKIQVYNTPVVAINYVHQLGLFGQDSWNIGHLTLNLGARVDRASGWIPNETSPAGNFVPTRTVARTDVYKQWMPVWRTGLAFDVFGNGKTAIKANVSRYGAQVGAAQVVNSVNPFSLSTATVAWNDLNGDGLPQPNELGTFEGFTGGATTRYASANGPAWAYSDEITAGIEHELAKSLRVGLMYYHRTNRNLTGTFNMAVPSSAYTPVTVPNPLGGTPLTVYNLNKAYVGLQDNLLQATSLLNTDYNGVDLTAAKRFSARWQMMAGFTVGKNKGGINNGDLNDPNNLNNMQGIIGNDSTYQFKLSGTYVLPGAFNVSGSFLTNTGYPRQLTYTVTRAIYPGLTRASQTVYMNQRGDPRLPNVTMADVRLSRTFKFGRIGSLEPQLEVFNIANNDVILNMVNAVGARLGYPSEILAPRILRLGVSVKF